MLPQATPREGGKPRPIHWSYVSIAKGTELVGYLGARTQWIWLHPSQQSKPCLYEMTAGELDCPHCAKGKIAEVKGFVGMYRATDYKPCGFWVNEEMRDILDRMQLHTRVCAARERTKGSPVSVRPMLDQNPRFETSLPERRVWSDTTVSLLKLLKCGDLFEWMRQTQGLELADAPARETAAPVEAAPPPAAHGSAAAAAELPYLLGESWFPKGETGDRLKAARNRNEAFIEEAKKPKRNGKH